MAILAIIGAGAFLSLEPDSTSVGTAIFLERAALVESHQSQHGGAIGGLGNGGHAVAGKLHAAGSGLSPTNSFTSAGASETMRFTAIERAEPGVEKGFLPVAVGLAKCRTGLSKDHGAGDIRVVRQQLLDDHAADRMSNQDGLCRADLLQEILQSIGE